MPYNDPHTAAPCLWAIRDRDGPGFDCSWTTPPAAADAMSRKGLEAALVAVHRRTCTTTPTANCGGMIGGYQKSRNRSTGDRGRRVSDTHPDAPRRPSVEPLPWTDWTEVCSTSWMGLDGTVVDALASVSTDVPNDSGLYRLWDPTTAPPLHYVGQSAHLRSRLYAHRRNRDVTLRVAYAPPPGEAFDARRCRLEVETECLGAHYLAVGVSPEAQF